MQNAECRTKSTPESGSAGADVSAATTGGAKHSAFCILHSPFRVRLLIALGLFAIGAGGKLVLARQVDQLRSAETPVLTRSVAEFPQRLGLWEGADVPYNDKILRDIKLDEHLHREYVHPSGERLILWFAYSKRSLDQYHHPKVCMPANGWKEDESACHTFGVASSVAAAAGGDVPVVRYFFTMDKTDCLVHYWYYLIGEDPIDKTMRTMSRYARVFLRGRRNASLTVETFSQSPNPDPKLLDEFARLVAKEIEPWMPPGTTAASESGAKY